MNLLRIIQKFNRILSKHQKRRVLELGLMMVVGGFFEMLSVSLVLPFVEAVIHPDEVMSKDSVQLICSFFGLKSHRDFIVFLALSMAGIYVLKNLFLILQMYFQRKFVSYNLFLSQRELLRNFLLRPYEYYLSASSGEILRVISADTVDTFDLMTNILSLFTELIVAFTLIITVLLVSPLITLGMSTLLVIMVIIIMRIIRPILRKAGKQNQEAYSGMQNWILQSIQGIKDLKIAQKESFFANQFEEYGKKYVKASYTNSVLSNVPRFLIEASMMSSFFLMIAFLLYKGIQFDSIVPILSAVAMAALRLLPSINRISYSMAGMAYGEAKLDKMIENLEGMREFKASGHADDKRSAAFDCLNMSELTYKYPTGESYILSNANLEIRAGESVGIVGTTGSGKTTAVDIMLGLLAPYSGSIKVNGVDIKDNKPMWLNMLGYIPQTIFLLDGSIKDNIAFGVPKEEISDEKVWNAIRESELENFVMELPNGLDTEIGERGIRLSGGQRQRIGIARALYNNPDVLFMDEATSALDNDTEKAIIDSIERLHGNKTMIIIAHRLTTIEKCDVVYRVIDGKIVKER